MAEPGSGCAPASPDLACLCQAIHEHAPLPMATVEGASHIVRYVNPAFCRLMGKPTEQLAGKPFAEIMPENDPCLMLLERVYRTGKSESHTGQQDPELPVGWSCTMWPVLVGEHPVGVMIQLTESAQFDGLTVAMNEALILGSVRQHELTEAAEKLNAQLQAEVAEREQAEQALRLSEERFRALFDRGPIAMYSCDVSGVIQNFNRCAVDLWGQEPRHGETDDQFRGSFKFYRPDGSWLSFAQTSMSKVLRGAVPAVYDQEVVVERPDGTRISVIVNVVPLNNDRGEIEGALNCFYDVTERSRLEHKLQEQTEALTDLDRRKDEFLAMLSHELRNPLAALSNAVHLLRLQKNEEPVQRQARSVIERQVVQLKHLVDDLLEISRITTGRVQLRRERIALGGIVERAIETAQPLVEQRRHELTVSLPPQPLWLQADPARLEQVLVNLLTNAAKYTDEGGSIWVELQQEGDEAVLRVRDTGVGIAPELLPRIFELFTQAERSIDRSQGGLGIGLCLVQRLVDLHGGTVTASSVLGQGSEFVVRLPALPIDLLQLPPPSPAAETADPPGTGCRILVVDDNVDAAQSLADLLEATGHVVAMAHDGPAALEAAQRFRPDVVLLDIGLPGLTGLEVAQRIRLMPALKHVVLVAITGYGQDTDRQRSKQAGFDHHLVKPADFDALQNILDSVAGAKGVSQLP